MEEVIPQGGGAGAVWFPTSCLLGQGLPPLRTGAQIPHSEQVPGAAGAPTASSTYSSPTPDPSLGQPLGSNLPFQLRGLQGQAWQGVL